MYRRNKNNHLKFLIPGFAVVIIGSAILGYINRPESAVYQEWHTTGKGYILNIPANVKLPALPPGALADNTQPESTNEDPAQPSEEPIQTATEPTLPAIRAEVQQPTQIMALETHTTPKAPREPIDRNSLRLSELNTPHPPRNNETQDHDLGDSDPREADLREGEAPAEPMPTQPSMTAALQNAKTQDPLPPADAQPTQTFNRDSLRLSNLQTPKQPTPNQPPQPESQFQTTTPNPYLTTD